MTAAVGTAVLARLPEPLAPLRSDLERLEALLRDTTSVGQPALARLLDWVFTSGGKRLRPALVFAAARLGSADPVRVTFLAAAIETLHTATLVHDDLVDGSLTRRGMPTVNARWSVGATVLAGDWLFARAARFAADTESVQAMRIFARTLGTLTDGELRQLLGRKGIPDREEYDFRIYAKTASLFEAATEATGVLLGASPREIAALARFGSDLGRAFQIVDDILDFTGESAGLGKPVGNDLRSGQVTLPAMLYLERHPNAAPWLADGTEPEPGDVDDLIARIRADEESLEGARAAADALRDAAIRALAGLPGGEARDDLARIAEYAVTRTR